MGLDVLFLFVCFFREKGLCFCFCWVGAGLVKGPDAFYSFGLVMIFGWLIFGWSSGGKVPKTKQKLRG